MFNNMDKYVTLEELGSVLKINNTMLVRYSELFFKRFKRQGKYNLAQCVDSVVYEAQHGLIAVLNVMPTFGCLNEKTFFSIGIIKSRYERAHIKKFPKGITLEKLKFLILGREWDVNDLDRYVIMHKGTAGLSVAFTPGEIKEAAECFNIF